MIRQLQRPFMFTIFLMSSFPERFLADAQRQAALAKCAYRRLMETRGTIQNGLRTLSCMTALVLLWQACCISTIGAEMNVVVQNSVPEAIIPTTKDLLLQDPAIDGEVKLQLFRLQGELAEWSTDGQWVVYDCKHKDGYYNIHVCRADGTEDRCLTTINNGVPHKHAGSPTWHPSKKYIAFAAEKKTHEGGSIEAIPGFGGRSDLWVMLADGSKSWPLTDTPDTNNSGVIIPKFSHDGRRIVWADRVARAKLLSSKQTCGYWDLKIADFIELHGVPKLVNIHSIRPGGIEAMNECYGFTPDDKSVIFQSSHNQRSFWTSQIFTCDADTGRNITQLTNNSTFNEHASFSRDGRHIVWMTSQGNPNHGTDWWIMRADGSHKRRLTNFNRPGYPESCSHPVYSVLTNWAPNGVQLLGGVQYSLIKQEGRIMLMTLDRSLLSD